MLVNEWRSIINHVTIAKSSRNQSTSYSGQIKYNHGGSQRSKVGGVKTKFTDLVLV